MPQPRLKAKQTKLIQLHDCQQIGLMESIQQSEQHINSFLNILTRYKSTFDSQCVCESFHLPALATPRPIGRDHNLPAHVCLRVVHQQLEGFPFVGLNQRKKVFWLEIINFELTANPSDKMQREAQWIIAYILQKLVCSNDEVTVWLKPCKCSRRAGFYILKERKKAPIRLKSLEIFGFLISNLICFRQLWCQR